MKTIFLLMSLFLSACTHREQGRLPVFEAPAAGAKQIVSDCLVRDLAALPVAVLREQGGAGDTISVRFDQAVKTEVRVTTTTTGAVSVAVYEDHGPWQYSQPIAGKVGACVQTR